MYNLILVDDEKNTLNNVSNSFNWDELGFSLIGMFTSAVNALDFIEHSGVNCVISDIRMPVMDGIEFSKIVHDRYPDIYFIILSAYAEFEYAQKAMSNNVGDYIIKPITFSKIHDALVNAKNELDKSKKFLHEISDKHKVVAMFVNGRVTSKENAIEMLLNNNIITDPDKAKFAIIRVVADDWKRFIEFMWPYDEEQFQNAFSNVIEQSSNEFIETMRGYGSVELLYISESDDVSFINCISENLMLIENNCFELLNLHVDCDVMQIFNNIDELIDNCFHKRNYKLNISDLIEYVMSGNIVKVEEYIEHSLSREYDVQYIANFFKCFVTEITNYVDLKTIDKNFTLKNLSVKSYDSIFQYTVELINKTAEYFARGKKDVPNAMRIIKDYIKEHYYEELTLSNISKVVFLSESHISRMFKRESGKSIVSYINEVRLVHAKEMLISSDRSIDEICYAVGYKSRNMFYKYFKSIYGKTPNMYRRSNDEKRD